MKKIWKNIKKQKPPYPNNGRIISAFDGAFIHPTLFHVNSKSGKYYFQSIQHPEEIENVVKWAFQDDLLLLP